MKKFCKDLRKHATKEKEKSDTINNKRRNRSQ